MSIPAFLVYSCASTPVVRTPEGTEPAGIVLEASPETTDNATLPVEAPPDEISQETPPETQGEPPDASGPAAEETAVSPPEVPLDKLVQKTPLKIPDKPLSGASGPIVEKTAAPPEISPDEPLPDASGPITKTLAVISPEALPSRDEPPPELPEIPSTPEQILGTGRIPSYGLALFLLSANPDADPGFVQDLALYYTEESAQEGINHDVAFAQMCLETGFLRYGGLVTPEMNNFCGLGSIGPGLPGEHFPSARIGARAHIQHLKAYATDAPLSQDLVDPRFFYVRSGSAPTLDGLAGSWAADREYSKKIRAILKRLYVFAGTLDSI
ncbi:MAG: glucosaminidase domain-containing protein [Treponema sp.]|nr:glucosaminidase domain-containing protein [Treponema sp.]